MLKGREKKSSMSKR